jgi:methionyl-tRNA formyltransferase
MQRAIIEGETVTGVTVMQMDVGLDTGDIISSASFPIGPRDNFGDIHDRSCEVGGELLIGTLRQIESGEAVRTPQNDAGASYAAKIEKAECKLDFTKSAKTLDCLIRGVTPIPGAFAYLNGKMLKINRARPIEGKGNAGEVISLNSQGEGEIVIACGEGALSVTYVIPEGKGKMTAGDFIRGRKISLGDILTYEP